MDVAVAWTCGPVWATMGSTLGVPMKSHLDLVLLIALPASGKSEVRRYLTHALHDHSVDTFHFADTVQLDDYPYVEFMRETDFALVELGLESAFFTERGLGGFRDGAFWGTLLQLVNDDFGVMADPKTPLPSGDPVALFARFDAALEAVGATPVFRPLDDDVRARLATRLAGKAAWLVDELLSQRPASLDDKTLVIEFARGGPVGAAMPLTRPHGYGWNLAQLRPEILEQAAVLYIWVEPEESRRKNAARMPKPGDDTTIFHAAPESVMLNDYGCDDIAWLVEQAEQPNTIEIEAHGRTWVLPIGRFDNRRDLTTFLRGDPDGWDPELRAELHTELKATMDRLWAAHQRRG